MVESVKRKYLAVIAAVVLSLPFSQLPVTTANAAICQGEAAYPPDLPDCLSPVVAAEQAAAAKAVADVDLAPGGSEELLANFSGGVGKISFVDQPLVLETKLSIKDKC